MSGPAASRPAADRNAQPVARHSQDGTWVASRLRRWRSARTWANPGPVKYRCSRVRSEEHTSELQSLMRISYAVFCLKKKQYTYTKKHTDRKNRQYRVINDNK